MEHLFLKLKNASAAPLSALPCPGIDDFRQGMIWGVRERKMRVSSFFALPVGNEFRLIAVLAEDASSFLYLCSTVVSASYESLTPECSQFHWFEREIAEQYGIRPLGHPWLKPIRFQHRMNDENGKEILPGVTDYFTMEGTAAHEVAVGPVHAGVIEPGHFRFQCMGETVYSLEIELGYQHRGIEKMLIGGPDKRTIHFMETASGDSTIASATAYAQIMEALNSSLVPSERMQNLRAIALEMERIANHVGDLGALAGDVAFLPSASYCGRIRGEYLNMTAELCGNRFGRTFVVPGGTRYDVGLNRALKISTWMDRIRPELENALGLMFNAPSVLDRFEGTGTVSAKNCEGVGMVGVAARACGSDQDVRRHFPYGIYHKFAPAQVVGKSGDVFARASVRRYEIRASEEFIRARLAGLPHESQQIRPPSQSLAPDSIAVSLVEAWRGEMCHVALTDSKGSFRRYKITDPSFHNWYGLALALRGEQISNFPICNKSFNLSYCGHDL